jgi:hypothetical protein
MRTPDRAHTPPIGRQRQRGLSVVARMLEQGARDEDVQRAGDLAARMAVSHAAGEMGALGKLGVSIGDVDQGERQDAHEAAVALVALAGWPCLECRHAGAQPCEGSRRGGADVEDDAPDGVAAFIGPRESTATLVLGIEAGAEERVEQGEHQCAVVAPRAGRLVVRAVPAQLDPLDVVAELVRHTDRIADQVAVYRGAELFVRVARHRQSTVVRPHTRGTRIWATQGR